MINGGRALGQPMVANLQADQKCPRNMPRGRKKGYDECYAADHSAKQAGNCSMYVGVPDQSLEPDLRHQSSGDGSSQKTEP